MNIKRSLVSLSLLSVLSACGGGGSSATSSGGGATSPKFSTVVSVTNSCGNVTSRSADVVFHDKDGKTIRAIKSDDNGKIDAELPKGTQHISVIATSTNKNNKLSTFVNTYLDVSEGLVLNQISHKNNVSDQTCSCTYEARLDTSELKSALTNYDLHGADEGSVWLNSADDFINMCSSEQFAYLHLANSALDDYRAAKLDLSNETITLRDSDFSHEGVKVEQPYVANQSFVSVNGVKGTKRILRNYDGDNLHIFPSLTSENTITSQVNETIDTNNGSITSYALAFRNVDENGQYQLLKHLPGYDIGYEFINSFLSSFSAQNGDELSFNYSSAVPSADLVIHELAYYDNRHGNVNWEIHSEASATIPDLEFDTVFTGDQIDESSLTMWFHLYDLNYSQSYVDILNKLSEPNLEKTISSGLYDGAATIHIVVSQ
ncbi:hypothetical protein ACSLBF_18600 (plasmid) [Pseudoalteromonas sp. T1lg65]|uniref:hypothetical protein n=1 Tax=Pseudoalteromonas sp. T1lg65 TaxID=2077101 RepID=UPI003F7AFA7B